MISLPLARPAQIIRKFFEPLKRLLAGLVLYIWALVLTGEQATYFIDASYLKDWIDLHGIFSTEIQSRFHFLISSASFYFWGSLVLNWTRVAHQELLSWERRFQIPKYHSGFIVCFIIICLLIIVPLWILYVWIPVEPDVVYIWDDYKLFPETSILILIVVAWHLKDIARSMLLKYFSGDLPVGETPLLSDRFRSFSLSMLLFAGMYVAIGSLNVYIYDWEELHGYSVPIEKHIVKMKRQANWLDQESPIKRSASKPKPLTISYSDLSKASVDTYHNDPLIITNVPAAACQPLLDFYNKEKALTANLSDSSMQDSHRKARRNHWHSRAPWFYHLKIESNASLLEPAKANSEFSSELQCKSDPNTATAFTFRFSP